jgi:hypothetical protein
MTRSSAIRKVRALLALAERPGTEAEGQVARERADALITRFELQPTEYAPEPERRLRPVVPPSPAPFGFEIIITTTGTTSFSGTGNAWVTFR